GCAGVHDESRAEAMAKLRDAGLEPVKAEPFDAHPRRPKGAAPAPHSHKVSAHQALVRIPRDRRPCGQRNWQATRAWLQRTNLWRERTNLKPRTRSVQKIIQRYSTSGAVHSSALVKKAKN